MTRHVLALAATLLLASHALAADAPPRARKVRVAVMEIRSLGTASSLADLLSEVALTEVGAMDRIDVIGRSDIDSMLGFERQKKVLGCTDEAGCLAEIGGALGVEFVVVGSLGRIGDLYRLDMKLVETAKGRVRSRTGESVDGREEKLVAAVQKAVHRLLDPLVQDSTGLLPPPPIATVIPKAESAAQAATAPHTPTTFKEPASSRKRWGWIVGGAGAAAVAGGVVFGLSAKSAFDAEKAAAASGDLPGYKTNRDQAKSKALLADVLYGAGAVGLGFGTWLLLTSPSSTTPSVAINVAPTPSGALLVVAGGF